MGPSIGFKWLRTISVVPERVQWTIVHEHTHILGERERCVLYFHWTVFVECGHSGVLGVAKEKNEKENEKFIFETMNISSNLGMMNDELN